ncbi:MAG TPA: YigZ family protein [Bacilli bacterium]|jgi:uncharacterized YigZ family protein|nr:YigZ family protein [Acholeplasmataceae bacterium]HNZ77824.1 YigZ family protein [Bacilli bacterium]HOD60907.1 YigZ family protein [Bacilli bacterium]HOH61069.1 YigZ family protein [Bacilli bacterium]HPB48717.1 YigZ family protein [Bacilli bacterium]
MRTIDKPYFYEQTINRSRFICSLYPINNLDEANQILAQTRKQYYDATHNCYAYILGDAGEVTKNSDDKEPAQTAGIVIYEVLKKHNLTNILAIVTRYYGGIKLGAGGLIRAYSSSTSQAVNQAELLEIIPCLVIEITYDYVYSNAISALFTPEQELEKNFADQISFKYLIPAHEKDKIIEKITSITKNTATFKILQEITKPLKNPN